MESKTVEQAADELYALAPAEFTRARDERAKALRKEGRREDADAVKALRKPTVAAWALNQLARRRADDVERLIAAGEELRTAQEELLAGGDRKAFQSAASRERDEVAKLAGAAVELVSDAGERAGPGLREKMAETLHAAALDEETAEELRAGRLVREREAIGGFGGVMAAPPPGRAGGRRAPAGASAGSADESGANGSSEDGAGRRGGGTKRGKATGSSEGGAGRGGGGAKRGKGSGSTEGDAGRGGGGTRGKGSDGTRGKGSDGRGTARAAADAKAREDARRAQADRRAAAEQRQRLAAARTDERHARRELDAAIKAAEHAETRAEAARAHADEANARAKVTANRLKEARREQAAAKKAHARAKRALEAAEAGA